MKVNIVLISTHELDLPEEYIPLYEAAKKAQDILDNSNHTEEDWSRAYADWPEELAKQFHADLEMLFPDAQLSSADVRDGKRLITLYEA